MLKFYQTPYGEVGVPRAVCQLLQGGRPLSRLVRDSRIGVTSTPLFPKVISQDFANGSSVQVRRDLAEHHARAVSRSFVQGVTEAVGSMAQAKEDASHYKAPRLDSAEKVSIQV